LPVRSIIITKDAEDAGLYLLIKYTHQGISTIKAGPDRPDPNKVILNRYGSELKAFYLTMGRYDAGRLSATERRSHGSTPHISMPGHQMPGCMQEHQLPGANARWR